MPEVMQIIPTLQDVSSIARSLCGADHWWEIAPWCSLLLVAIPVSTLVTTATATSTTTATATAAPTTSTAATSVLVGPRVETSGILSFLELCDSGTALKTGALDPVVTLSWL